MKNATESDKGPGIKGFQIERAVIENASRLGIGTLKDLKSAIEHKAIDAIRPDTPANSVGCLDDQRTYAPLSKMESTAQTRQPGAYDDHIGFFLVFAHGRNSIFLLRHALVFAFVPKDGLGRALT
jgi:hypothetical protein